MIIRKYLFSLFYRATRFLARIITSLYQFIFNKKQDLESIVDFGDSNLVKIDKVFGGIAYQFSIPDNLDVELFDLKFKSPIIASSFKSDKNLIGIWLKLGLGGAILKTIMKEARVGNLKPRLQQVRLERQACLVNALGLPGEGVEKFSEEIIDNPLWNHKKPIGLSIGGENLDDYIKTFNVLDTISNKLKSSKYFLKLFISLYNLSGEKYSFSISKG